MVNDYSGKAETVKIDRRVSREIKPALKTLHSEKGGVITRKGGGK